MKDFLRTFGKPSSSHTFGYDITTAQESLVVSILSLGTVFGQERAYQSMSMPLPSLQVHLLGLLLPISLVVG
jgi:hypothetical protein